MSVPDSRWLLQSRLKIRQLLLLAALGDLANLRASAARLGMTQPAATKLLQDLEGALGVRLFDRSRAGMQPTVYGETMIRFARNLLMDLGSARDELQAVATGAVGRITVGVMASSMSELLPAALASLWTEHPGIHISLMEGTHGVLITALKQGELDVVLGRVMPGMRFDDVEMNLLYHDQFRVVSGPTHPLASSASVSLQALAEQRWILPQANTAIRQRLEIAFLEATGRRPDSVMESMSLLINLALLRRSHVLALMPADVATEFARTGQLCLLPINIDHLVAPVALITRHGQRLSPVLHTFMQHLRQASAG